MLKRALVVYNPLSHATANPQMWLPDLTRELCENRDYLITLYALRRDKSQDELATVASFHDLVIAAGGDGTIRTSLAAMASMQSDIPVALLPMGTANVLARNLGIVEEAFFANPLKHAVDVIVNGVPAKIDLGVMNDQFFAVTAGVGPLSDAFLAPDDREKARFKIFAYAAHAIQTMNMPAISFSITADGESFEVEATGVFASNVEDLGIGKVPDFNLLRDGLLDLYVFNPKEFVDYVNIGFRFAGGKENSDPPYFVRRVREATIRVANKHAPTKNGGGTILQSPEALDALTGNGALAEVATMLDGDECGTTPITCSVLPQAVNVVIPAGKIG
ncbi:MAG TPA: diacylglycerol kinase family protein [Chroococcales cyanobacterium]